MNTIEQANERFLHSYLRRLDRRARREAKQFLHEPIRFLGACLFCDFPSITILPNVLPPGALGVYVPQTGSPISQFVIYTFCEMHARDPRRFDSNIVEQFIVRECDRRPHDFSFFEKMGVKV